MSINVLCIYVYVENYERNIKMQLTKMLKKLMLVVSFLVITTCSLHKNEDSIEESNINNSSGTTNMSINNTSYDEAARLRIQEFKRNNIVYFDLDKYDIQFNFTNMLDAHANFLRSNPLYKVIIEGHTDERGTPEYNIALGERRANAIKMYLQGKGVPTDQISIISYGKEKPVVLGHSEAAYAKNRRAVLVY